jgi:hypothetical protein
VRELAEEVVEFGELALLLWLVGLIGLVAGAFALALVVASATFLRLRRASGVEVFGHGGGCLVMGERDEVV